MNRYKIKIPRGNVAFCGNEAFTIARQFGAEYEGEYIVKAQVQADGRSKGYFLENDFKGGIHRCADPIEVKEVAEMMCGKKLMLPSTEPYGFYCSSVYVQEAVEV